MLASLVRVSPLVHVRARVWATDSSTPFHKARGVYSKFGLHPGHALYQHIGLLFYKYLGSADITFKQLYDIYGVELAVTVTNISRASVEILHVKTSPDYPIRKAVRASMSLPVALHPCRDKNIHTVVSEHVHEMTREMEASGENSIMHVTDSKAEHAKQTSPTELYVDGGVLANYPIDCFDGWWLSMEKEDAFFRRVVGEGGHKNYVERFGSIDEKKGVRAVNAKTMGFRLASAWEPDAMHSRLGNDALELRVRKSDAAMLPDTPAAQKYAPFRYHLTNQAQAHLKLDRDLRAAMTWIKARRDEARDELAAKGKGGEPEVLDIDGLTARLANPPAELLASLGIGEDAADTARHVAEMLRHHHFHCHIKKAEGGGKAKKGAPPTRQALDAVLETDGWASKQIKDLYQRPGMADGNKLASIQAIVRASQASVPALIDACDELEELLENKAEEVMKRLLGMAPKEIGNLAAFVARMIEAIQMTNDERVQTKENYSRTCMLNTEYVGTMDFKLDEADYYFLWRKGFLSTLLWLEKRTSKAKDKKKKVGKAIAAELKKEASKAAGLDKAVKDSSKPTAENGNGKAGGAAGAAKAPSASVLKWGAVARQTSGNDLKAGFEKVLHNELLTSDEKVDILQRKLQVLITSSAAAPVPAASAASTPAKVATPAADTATPASGGMGSPQDKAVVIM